MKAAGAKSSVMKKKISDWAKGIGLSASYSAMNGCVRNPPPKKKRRLNYVSTRLRMTQNLFYVLQRFLRALGFHNGKQPGLQERPESSGSGPLSGLLHGCSSHHQRHAGVFHEPVHSHLRAVRDERELGAAHPLLEPGLPDHEVSAEPFLNIT